MQRCLEAGLVEGRNLAVDGTLVGANASQQSRVPRKRLVEAAQVSRTVQEYLKELEQENPVTDWEQRPIAQKMVSMTDPDAAWAVKSGPATLGYYDNYLVDTTSRVILSVDATPAGFRQEVLAAQRMIEHVSRFGIRPQNLAADKAYGSGEFLAWLLERDIQPHIPVIDRPEFKRSQRARYKVQALFAELKQQIKLRRVRLRRLWNVAEQFQLAATAQNLTAIAIGGGDSDSE